MMHGILLIAIKQLESHKNRGRHIPKALINLVNMYLTQHAKARL